MPVDWYEFCPLIKKCIRIYQKKLNLPGIQRFCRNANIYPRYLQQYFIVDLVDGMLPLSLDPIYGFVCVTFPKINNKIDLSGNFWNNIDYKKIWHFEMLVKRIRPKRMWLTGRTVRATQFEVMGLYICPKKMGCTQEWNLDKFRLLPGIVALSINEIYFVDVVLPQPDSKCVARIVVVCIT